jgi:hypothetical protein
MDKKDVLRVVLDQPRLFIEKTGSAMVRGEVFVHFLKDTQIQGPIELLFEGVQNYQLWPGKKEKIVNFLLMISSLTIIYV